jgi:ketosteroid isomerase-like protein
MMCGLLPTITLGSGSNQRLSWSTAMALADLETASKFRTAVEVALQTGEREAVYALLSSDIEWITPQRTLQGIDGIKDELTWGTPSETLDVEFEEGDWVEQGDGRVGCEVHEVYRLKGSGEVAYERDRSIELTVSEGKVSRYEMRIVG